MYRSPNAVLIASLAIIPPAFGQVTSAGDSSALSRASSISAVDRGARVRVTAPSLSLEQEIGTLSAVHTDTLFLGPEKFGESVRVVPLSAVTQLELSEGRRSYAKFGAGVGAVVGLVAGLAVAASQTEKETCNLEQEGLDCLAPDFSDVGSDLAKGFAIMATGTLGGAGLGALVGSAFHTERWTTIEGLDLSLSLTGDGGLGLAVSSRI